MLSRRGKEIVFLSPHRFALGLVLLVAGGLLGILFWVVAPIAATPAMVSGLRTASYILFAVGLIGIAVMRWPIGRIERAARLLVFPGFRWSTEDIVAVRLSARNQLTSAKPRYGTPVKRKDRVFDIELALVEKWTKKREKVLGNASSKADREQVVRAFLSSARLLGLGQTPRLGHAWLCAEGIASSLQVAMLDDSDLLRRTYREPNELNKSLVDGLRDDASWVPSRLPLPLKFTRDLQDQRLVLGFRHTSQGYLGFWTVLTKYAALCGAIAYLGAVYVLHTGPSDGEKVIQYTVYAAILGLFAGLIRNGVFPPVKRGTLELSPDQIHWRANGLLSYRMPIQQLEAVRADALEDQSRTALISDSTVIEIRFKSEDCARWLQSEILNYLAALSPAAHPPAPAPSLNANSKIPEPAEWVGGS